ncbi:MAG: hypothetical protein WBX25_12825 [Rhodomicrobium sp.]
MRVGLDHPRWTPQEVLLPQLADETPAERRTRAAIMGDNIRVGHLWVGIRFDAFLLERPMATADAYDREPDAPLWRSSTRRFTRTARQN